MKTLKPLNQYIKSESTFYGDSKSIFKNTLSINLTLLSILIALYLAAIAYFIPLIKQIEFDIEIKYNQMFGEIRMSFPSYPSERKSYYYTNDTISLEKVLKAFYRTTDETSLMYKKRDQYPIEELTLKSIDFLDTLGLISLIATEPYFSTTPSDETITNLELIYGQNYVPYDRTFFHELESMLLAVRIYRLLNMKNDVKLIEYCSGYYYDTPYPNSTSGTWAHDDIKTIKNAPDLSPSRKEYYINSINEDVEKSRKQRIRYLNFYESIDSIYDNYISVIRELDFKKQMYSQLKTILINLHGIIIFAFFWNILIPIIFSNKQINNKLAFLHLILGLIPYSIVLSKTLGYINSLN